MNKLPVGVLKIIDEWTVSRTALPAYAIFARSVSDVSPSWGYTFVLPHVYQVFLVNERCDHHWCHRLTIAYRRWSARPPGEWVCLRSDLALRQWGTPVQYREFRNLYSHEWGRGFALVSNSLGQALIAGPYGTRGFGEIG